MWLVRFRRGRNSWRTTSVCLSRPCLHAAAEQSFDCIVRLIVNPRVLITSPSQPVNLQISQTQDSLKMSNAWKQELLGCLEDPMVCTFLYIATFRAGCTRLSLVVPPTSAFRGPVAGHVDCLSHSSLVATSFRPGLTAHSLLSIPPTYRPRRILRRWYAVRRDRREGARREGC